MSQRNAFAYATSAISFTLIKSGHEDPTKFTDTRKNPSASYSSAHIILMAETWSIVDLPNKGKGVVADIDMKAGSLLLAEPALIKLPPAEQNKRKKYRKIIIELVQALGQEEKRSFFDLANTYPDMSPYLAIVKTNAMPLGSGSDKCGIFPQASRFNHSCVSNAGYSWCEKKDVENIILLKDVVKGDEITVSYLGDEQWMLSRSERQHHLKNNVGFECACNLCSADEDTVQASDKRRQELKQLESDMAGGEYIVLRPAQALQRVKRMLELYEEERESSARIIRVYDDAFLICVAQSDFARASAFAKKVVAEKIRYQGEDAADLEVWRKKIEEPERHRAAGQTRDWASKATDAKAETYNGFENWLWARCAKGDIRPAQSIDHQAALRLMLAHFANR